MLTGDDKAAIDTIANAFETCLEHAKRILGPDIKNAAIKHLQLGTLFFKLWIEDKRHVEHDNFNSSMMNRAQEIMRQQQRHNEGEG